MNQAQRILTILEKLSRNSNADPICTSALATEYYEQSYSSTKENALRTAQNDMKLIKSFLGDDISTISRGCYILVNEDFIGTIFQTKKDRKKYKNFFEFLLMFDERVLENIPSGNQKKYIHKLKKDVNEIYSIHTDPIENLLTTDIMSELKRAVKYRRYTNITIFDDDNLLADNNDRIEVLKDLQSHRIVFAQGNWYLSVFNKDIELNGGFRFLRISKIKNVDISSKTFQKNKQVDNFINTFQSLFTYFNRESFRVVVKISPDVSKFFINKKFLSSQVVADSKYEDGSLKVYFEINNEMEIMPLIQKWLPNIEIVSPSWLRNLYIENLSKMLQKLTS